MDAHLTLIISGNVQGVLFRESARREALRLGLLGFARNEPDGSVHIEAEGEESHLRLFLAWCRKGPASARVEQVEERWSGELRHFKNFMVQSEQDISR